MSPDTPSPFETLASPPGVNQQPAPKRAWPFRWLLPYVEILLCFALLFPYRASIVADLFPFARSWERPLPGITLNPDGTVNIDPNGEFQRWFNARDRAFEFGRGLNLPLIILDLPYAILNPDHGPWSPGHIDPKTLRAVIWPFLAIPLWWMAGCGLEALIATRRKLVAPRIGWFSAIVSFLLMAAGATLAIGILLFSTPDDRADRQFMILGGGALVWTILGSFCVLAKIAQWRISKRALAGVSPPAV